MRPRHVMLLTGVLAVLFVPVLAIANRSGPPAGYTGAPAVNGRNCTNCHIGTANSGPGKVTITTQNATYAPGSVIPVTVALGGTLQNPNVNGFQMAAYATGNNTALTGWTSPDLNAIQIVADHVEHAFPGTSQTSWTVYFKTPASPVTGFTFHSAGNDANGNGFNTGDRIYTTNRPMTAGVVNLSMRSVPVPGSNVAFDLDAPGDGSKSYVMAASLSNAGFVIAGKTIPLFPDSIFGVTAGNVLPTIFQNYHGVLDTTGKAVATLAVLNNASLKGITLHHAFVVLDPGKPGGIGTVSNGLAVTIF